MRVKFVGKDKAESRVCKESRERGRGEGSMPPMAAAPLLVQRRHKPLLRPDLMDCYFQIHTQNMRNLGESMHSPFLRCVGPEGEVGVELQEDGGWRTFNTHPRTHQRPDATTAGRDGVRDTPVEVELLACAVSASSPAAVLRERTREEVRPERERERERWRRERHTRGHGLLREVLVAQRNGEAARGADGERAAAVPLARTLLVSVVEASYRLVAALLWDQLLQRLLREKHRRCLMG